MGLCNKCPYKCGGLNSELHLHCISPSTEFKSFYSGLIANVVT